MYCSLEGFQNVVHTYIHNFNSMLTSLWAGCLKDGRYKVVLSLSPMPESISTFHLEMKAAFSEF